MCLARIFQPYFSAWWASRCSRVAEEGGRGVAKYLENVLLHCTPHIYIELTVRVSGGKMYPCMYAPTRLSVSLSHGWLSAEDRFSIDFRSDVHTYTSYTTSSSS